MAKSLWDWTLGDALDATSSAQPTPGGGSIAAVTAALGVGLVLMALEITNKGHTNKDKTLDAQLPQGRELLEALRAHADRDIAVFSQYMAALGMPKADESQRAARRVSLQEATLAATHAPLTAAEDCLRALVFAESTSSQAQRNVMSDVLAGADLLLGASRAVLRNVDINLPGLRDTTLRSDLAARRAELAQAIDSCYARIQHAVASRSR